MLEIRVISLNIIWWIIYMIYKLYDENFAYRLGTWQIKKMNWIIMHTCLHYFPKFNFNFYKISRDLYIYVNNNDDDIKLEVIYLMYEFQFIII